MGKFSANGTRVESEN